MFLKRMEIKGFKSFAYPTTIEFDDGLIVVVGPNGSGKSNINDAFKWVLGEASKKTLRASSASDMIFSGSDTEQPADLAEVVLIFNNEDRVLNLDFNEVAITRRSFRDDKLSEYYINKTLVRRKDVRDLFLGTGLGNTDLSIISQGSVTKITDSKPKDLRVLLNEAAGISRYQSQKDEAVRKLEKTSQSLGIFSVKLRELERQIGPLKKKKEMAEKYFSIKGELEKIELPIIKDDLTKNVKLREELMNDIEDSARKKVFCEDTLSKIEQKIRKQQEKTISLEEELYSLQIKQNELNTRDAIIENDEVLLKSSIEKVVKGIKDISLIEKETVEKYNELTIKIKKIKDEEHDLVTKKENLEQKINRIKYEIHKLSSIRNNEMSGGTLAIIKNKKIFNEVYGVIGDLIKFDKKFENAIKNSIGNKLNNIVVSNEEVIKEALSFLKSNKAGKATFVPAEKVKPRTIPEDYQIAIKNLDGYLGTIASILKIDSKFKNVAKSIGGHILVFEEINSALEAAKLLGYRYEIVTLDGDQIFTGFTVRGGSSVKGGRLSEFKNTLVDLENQFKNAKELQHSKQEEIQSIRDSIAFSQTELVRSQDRIAYLESNLQKLLDQHKTVTGTSFDLETFKKTNEFISTNLSIEQINNRIKNIQLEKKTIQKEIISEQEQEQELRKDWKESINVHTDATLLLNKIVLSISRDLEILNKDYKITYENLLSKEIPALEISFEKASLKREELRIEISKLGFIDFDAVSSYEELFGTHETLEKNVKDLTESKEKLLSTIETMNNQMQKQFEETFEKVNTEFQKVFETLFKGGEAKIIYTEPDNILDTGVEVEAKMAGKTVKSISLYSGGEKSLISLSLIFAINKVRNLPILMLDEVEAALDESNVDRFARFAKELNKDTQIVITSHRPGTMEQADILYGVTMQKKGITSIVSVKLADAVKMVD